MSDSSEERHYFTVAEANALLPTVKELLVELRRAVAGLEDLKKKLSNGEDELDKPEPDTQVDPTHFMLVGLFHHALGRFHELGIEVKDASRGLIDFPALIGEEEVRLCWLEGEDAVLYYHDLQSGFAGRKPIEAFTPPPRDDEPEEEG